MKNSYESIGQRIRLERLRHNMTQTELADGIITRNMLSMIESGKAVPSVETLVQFSNKLDVSAGYFMAGNDYEEALYTKIQTVSRAKYLFRNKKFAECVDLCKGIPFDDEMSALLAECELQLAVKDMNECFLTAAAKHLNNAKLIADKTIYLGDDFKGTADAYMFLISCADGNIDIDKLNRISRTVNRIQPEIFVYIYLLYLLDKGDYERVALFPLNSQMISKDRMLYLKANGLTREMNFTDALALLLSIENSKNIGFITRYRVYADIEKCYESKRDFENAYRYSSLKHRMLEQFRK